MSRRVGLGALLVTLVEGAAIYGWLLLDDAGAGQWLGISFFVLGIAVLFVGEVLETAIIGYRLRSTVAPIPPGDPEGAGAHRRAMRRTFSVASLLEIGIWVFWLWLATETTFPDLGAAAVLLVLMHLKHQLETASIRDMPYFTGLWSPTGLIATLTEVAGVVAALALLEADRSVVLAAAAVAAGLLIEHVLLIAVLYREMAERDISLPRLRRPRMPLTMRIVNYLGIRLGWLWRLCQRIGPVARFINRRAIDELIAPIPARPDRLSTMAAYTSWESLTDRTWSGRHLPPVAWGPRGLPDVDAVAALFVRGGEMTPCPRSTVLFAYFAQWFTDGFLRTSRDGKRNVLRNTLRNESTHAIDLSQLYGLNSKMTDALRLKRGGLLRSQQIHGEEYPEYLCRKGKIKKRFKRHLIRPFGFKDLKRAERNRLFAMGTDTRNVGFVAFNVLFLREHNRIARTLAAVHPDWDDDRLFRTARCILIVVLLRIVIEEYVNHITGLYFHLRLPAPKTFTRAPWQRPNWMAIEFNLLYRWHTLVPSTLRLGDKQLTIDQTLANTKLLTSGGLRRFMLAASAQPAGRITLFNTAPGLVEAAEKPSIAQARVARLRSYNDYRELCGLPRARHFGEFSTDPRVRDGLKRLYDHVDDVEFYVGLFAEEAADHALLPPLMVTMVAFDAFSQVLTNPLVSPQIYGPQTFSETGMKIIEETSTLGQIVARNVPDAAPGDFVGMRRRDYTGP